MPIQSIFLLAAFLPVLLILYLFKRRGRRGLPLPPGPRGYPIIGNLMDIRSEAIWVKYHELCQKVGSDIMYLNVAGQDYIVLDSVEAAEELLERRSSIYSDRPVFPMLSELMGFDFNVVLASYGEQWRAKRKLMHQDLNASAVKNLRPHFLNAARRLLYRCLDQPEGVWGHLRHMTRETMLSITYGLDAQSENDPYINVSEESIRAVTLAATPGAFLVNSFPILKYIPEWMPGAGFKRKAKECKRLARNLLEVPFAAAMKRIGNASSKPSFVSRCVSHITKDQDRALQEQLIKQTAASLHSGGSETTSTLIAWCIVALLNHPSILRRAQEEIDSVLPFGSLPTFENEDKLPLVTAICMETMRWRAILPIAFPHLLTKEDIYMGYRIPKGAVVVANSWAMLNDDAMYPEPLVFNPDRFLKDGVIDKRVPNPSQGAVFGFGRRVCPGKFMASSFVWITVALLIAAFDITESTDANGNVVKVNCNEEEHTGLLRSPRPFTCLMKPRSKKHEEAIRASVSHECEFHDNKEM